MDVVRARWSSSSFLLYAGTFVVLFAAIALLGWLASEHSDGAFFGWSALVFAVIAVVAIGFEAAGERVTAGLFAFVSLDHVLGLGRLVRGPHRDPRRRRRAVRRLPLGPAALRPRDHHGVADPPCPLPVPPARATRGLHELVLRRRPRLRRGELVGGRVDHRRVLLDARRRGRRPDLRLLGPLRRCARDRRRLHLPLARVRVGVDPHRPDRAPVLPVGGRVRPLDLRRAGRDRPLPRVDVLRGAVDGRRGRDALHRGVDAAGLHVRQRRAQRVGRRDAVRALRARARRDRPLARAAQARGSSPSLPSRSAYLQLAA